MIKAPMIENQGKTEVANSQIIVIFLCRFSFYSYLCSRNHNLL